MATIEHRTTLGRGDRRSPSEADIDEFVETLERFERGDLAPDQWRAFRLVRGTYGQRQADDAQMLRVKIPQGVLTDASCARWPTSPSATRAGSATSRRGRTSSSTSSSCTTSSPPCGGSAEAGLTTREACGNSVRNITACPFAGRGRRRSRST